MVDKKNDEKVLFPEIIIGKYTLKPWTFGTLFTISEQLGIVVEKAEQRNLVEELNNSSGFLPYTTLVKLFSIAGPEVLKIMSITLEVSEEEIQKLSLEEGMHIAYSIFDQNKTTILGSISKMFTPTLPREDQEIGA
jgi:hypothetical protein